MTAQNRDEKMSKTEEKEEETESRTKHRGMKRAQSANIAEKRETPIAGLETILVLYFFIDRCPINRDLENQNILKSFLVFVFVRIPL